MMTKITNKIAQTLAEKVGNSGKYRDFSQKQIEEILEFDMTKKLRQLIWVLLLFSLSYGFFFIGIDVRFSVLIIFCTVVAFRNMLGGYHSDSPLVCLIISTIIPIVLGLISISVDFNIYAVTSIYIFAYVTVKSKGVVDHPNRRFQEGNKTLNLEMKSRLIKIGLTLLILINILHIVIFAKGYFSVSNPLALGVFISFLNLYFGK
jgi:accessory gene regulator protein AgrB